MRAIAATPGTSEPAFVDLAEPSPIGPTDVVCRTVELGICGTDREILESKRPLVPRGAACLVLGHECLGVVEKVGGEVDGFTVGDYVVPLVRRPKGNATGRVDLLAFGDYLERGIVEAHGFSAARWTDDARYLMGVSPGLRSVAVLVEPFSVAEKGVHEAEAMQQARLGANVWKSELPRVLVTGMGPIGFAAVACCRSRGWPTTMAGRDPDGSFRIDLATRFGAEYITTERMTQVEGDGRGGEEFDLVLECTGNDRVIGAASLVLAPRGAMVWLGSSRNPAVRDHNLDELVRNAVLRNHLFLGSVNAAIRDFHAAIRCLEFWQRNAPELVSQLITTRVPPQESLWHFANRERQGIKAVVTFE